MAQHSQTDDTPQSRSILEGQLKECYGRVVYSHKTHEKCADISFVEQPARLGLDDHALLAQWKPAYKRGFAMQAPLAVVGFVLGIVAWWLTGGVMFLIGGVLLLANWPWTAMDHFRHHADQRGADGDRAGGGESTQPGFDCEVESSSLCPDSPWMPRDPSLSDRALTIRLPRHFRIASRRRIAKVSEFAKMRYARGG